MNSTIEIKNLSTGYNKKIVSEVDNLTIEQGKVVAILGTNGAGKTTLIKTILGLLQPIKGSVKVFGSDKRTPGVLKGIGYASESSTPPPELTVEEYLKSCAALHSSENLDQMVTDCLDIIGMTHARSKKIAKISKGMKQRVNIGQSLIHRPQLVILDEPSSGLDPAGRFIIVDIINALKKLGTTIIFTSHNTEEVRRCADKILLLGDAKKLYYGKIPEGDLLDFYRKHALSKESVNIKDPVDKKTRSKAGLIATLTKQTVAQGVRSKNYHIAGFITLCLMLAMVKIGSSKMPSSSTLALSAAFTGSWVISIIASAFIGEGLIGGEVRRKTKDTLFCQPLSSGMIALGKLIGGNFIISGFIVAMNLAITLISLTVLKEPIEGLLLFQAVVLQFFAAWIIIALSYITSAFSRQQVVITIVTFITTISWIGFKPLGIATPPFDIIDISGRIVHNHGIINWSDFTSILLFATAWIIASVTGALMVTPKFKKKA